MNDAPETDREYTDLAYASLKAWVLSDDEPAGARWDLYCDKNGVDPELFADMVRYQRRKRAARLVA